MEYTDFTIDVEFVGEGYDIDLKFLDEGCNVVLCDPKNLSEDLQLFFGEFLKGDKGDKGDPGVGIPQTLELSGRTLSISDGNSVSLPEGFSGRYQDLIGKPVLSTVATTGNYGDLFGKPDIPSVLADLSDIDISGVSDGQTIQYNSTTHKWENANAGSYDFICTFTLTGISGGGTIVSCDRAITEIRAAFEAGNSITGRIRIPSDNYPIYVMLQLTQIMTQGSVLFSQSIDRTSIIISGYKQGNDDIWDIDEETSVEYGTTSYWNSRIGYIPAAGTIIIYSDYATKTVNNETVYIPNIKIGSGNGYVQDLEFIGEKEAADLLAHISNTDIHVTASDKINWNSKLNVDDNNEVSNETLIFIRN